MSIVEQQEKKTFQTFLFFRLLVEIILYHVSVLPAYRRYVYQKYNTVWLKNGGIAILKQQKKVTDLYERHVFMRQLEERKSVTSTS